MTREIKHGSTDQSIHVYIVDSGDGTPEQGVTSATTGLALWYRRPGAAKTAISVSDLSALTDAHADGGLLHVDDGLYRLDLPDAACAAGVAEVAIGGAADGMVVLPQVIPLVAYDPADAVRLGLTALPNAAPAANGGLGTVDGSNRIAGIAGTLTTLDALDTAQDTQHAATQAAIPSAATVADAVWDEDMSGHLTDDTYGLAMSMVQATTSGTLSGAGMTTEVFVGLVSTVTGTVDLSGNRSAVVVS